MRFAIFAPPFGDFSDPRLVAELAKEIEAAGWDGFFTWDIILWDKPQLEPVADTWITLAVIAANTTTIKFGPVVTPVPRRRPWKLARETVTLDHLSQGRLVLGVGIGGDWYREFSGFGEATDDKLHAAMLDEGLEVLTRLWSGEAVTYQGQHYQLDQVQFLPRPIQQPRIPIWTGGMWPNKKPFQRAARWDGIAPGVIGRAPTPDDYRSMLAYVREYRTTTEAFDLVHGIDPDNRVETAGLDAGADRELVQAYAEAGVTWWLEDVSYIRGPLSLVRERIRRGPPRL